MPIGAALSCFHMGHLGPCQDRRAFVSILLAQVPSWKTKTAVNVSSQGEKKLEFWWKLKAETKKLEDSGEKVIKGFQLKNAKEI